MGFWGSEDPNTLCLLDVIKMFRLPNQAEGDYRENLGNHCVTGFTSAMRPFPKRSKPAIMI